MDLIDETSPHLGSVLHGLDTPYLVRIYRALHDLKDGGLHVVLSDLIWDRCAKPIPGEPWPVDDRGYVRYCDLGNGFADPAHQPVRRMDQYDFRGLECSCGARDMRHLPRKDPRVLKFKCRQLVANARVWPTRIIDGIPHFVVCKHSRSAEDPDHAPMIPGQDNPTQCICTGYLGAFSSDGSGNHDQLLPV